MQLIEQLVAQLGVTSEQAEGGAGILLQVAQDRLPREQFVKIADAIPAISDIIAKAPEFHTPPARGLAVTLNRLFGGLGGLAGLVGPFEKLGLSKLSIGEFVGVLLCFFREQGGSEIESLLRSALR